MAPDDDDDRDLLGVLERSRALGFLGPGPVEHHVLHARSFLVSLDALAGPGAFAAPARTGGAGPLESDPVSGHDGCAGAAPPETPPPGATPRGEVSSDTAPPDAAATGPDPTGPRCLDLGSGGGVPGLVLARLLAGSTWVLLDSMQRRTTILQDEMAALGWDDRVDVRCERAESAARAPEMRAQFDLVTARSFGAPGVTAECARGFLRSGGHLVVSNPPEGPQDRWPAEPLQAMGFAVLGHAAGCTVLRAFGPPADDVPRSVGKPAKRPRF